MRTISILLLAALCTYGFIEYFALYHDLKQPNEKIALKAEGQSQNGESNAVATRSNPNDILLSDRSIEDWLEKIDSAQQAEQHALLQLALKQFPYAPRLLLKEAHYYLAMNDLTTAIELLAEAHQYADEPLAADIDKTILNWMDTIAIDVNENSDWQQGNALFEHALSLFDDLKPLQLMHANLLFLMHHKVEAQLIVEELSGSYTGVVPLEIHHHELTNNTQLTRLKNYLRHDKKSAASVPLIKAGSHFLVDVLVSDQTNLRLMLDTGATLTVISEQKFISIEYMFDYSFIEERDFNTAGGRIKAPVYKASSLQIGNFKLNDIRFAVIPMGSDTFDGLLGMNVFSQFELSINQQESFLLLKRK